MHWNWYFFALFCFVIAQYFMSLKCNGRFIVLTPPSPAVLFLAMRTLITLLLVMPFFYVSQRSISQLVTIVAVKIVLRC